MAKIIGRSELYELVWSKPMTRVASELGISGVGLKKICIKNLIPTPPLSYWAKKKAGYNIHSPKLPERLEK